MRSPNARGNSSTRSSTTRGKGGGHAGFAVVGSSADGGRARVRGLWGRRGAFGQRGGRGGDDGGGDPGGDGREVRGGHVAGEDPGEGRDHDRRQVRRAAVRHQE